MSTVVPERAHAVPERAVIREPALIEALMRERRLRGLDRRDEVWEGVLHMVPPASEGHSGGLTELTMFLGPIAKRLGGKVRIEIGIRTSGSEDRNYRVPDLVYLAPEDLPRQGKVYFEGGGPAVVFEILSRNDDTYRKFDFYASVEVRELVIIDPHERLAEVYRLAGERYLAVAADREGRIPIQALGVRFERRADEPALFLLDDATGAEARIV